MSALANMRKLVDASNKANAKIPQLPTGGEGRMTSEAQNTSAIMQARGAQRAIPRTIGPMPLHELVKNNK